MNKPKEYSELEKKLLSYVKRRGLTDDEVKATIRALKQQRPRPHSVHDHYPSRKRQKTIMRLFHPGGGTAYALSYHPQKWAESLSGGEKPEIAGIGHYHKIEQLFYRNIHIFQTGTFEAQTPFMRRKKLAANLGAWILWINDQEPIGLLGDTHIGSKFYQPKLLDDYYKTAMKEGVKNFYHTGDITSGEKMYRGQDYEIYAHGFRAQAQAVVDEYPEHEGVKTYYILGNHDLSFWRTAGANISDYITPRRKDLIYIGDEEANIKISDQKIKDIKSLLVAYY